MRRLTRREAVLTAIGALVAVVLPLYLFVFMPMVKTIAIMNRQIQVKTRELAEVEVVAGRLPVDQHQRLEIDTRLRAMEQQMPMNISIPRVVGRLSQAIDASGVQLIEVTFPAGTQPSPQPTGPVEELPFTLRIRGTFTSVIVLMQHLEAPPRLMVGQTLGISDGGAGSAALSRSGPPLLDITMKMKAFALH